MRILQVIDSLEIGGAERMAVNYANSLAKSITFSGLVTTRKEGVLKHQLHENVSYLFLERKNTVDFSAIFRLKKYCILHKIDYLQAHSSSFFTAFLVKLVCPNIKIIWHDHNGLSEFLSTRKSLVLKIASYFFEGIVVVNEQLKNWATTTLHCKNILYLANFTSLNDDEVKQTSLLGTSGKQILCLANLRFQKNHFLLIEVAKMLKESHSDWSFHLVGKDFDDAYSDKIKAAIVENKLTDTVFIYGSKQDTHNCIKQAELCILTSQSEGLPVALLEYGLHKKAVVSTEVGEIPKIIKDTVNGFIVPKFDARLFYLSLLKLIDAPELRTKMGLELYQTILQHNSEKTVIEQYLNWINKISNAG